MFAAKPAQPPPEKKLHNINEDQMSSNQQAVPVPYGAGTFKIALTWINPPYNLIAKKKKQDSGGGKGGGKAGTSGGPEEKKWKGDICGVACVVPDDQPVDQLMYVLVNDEIAYEGPLTRVFHQHYASFSLQKYCQNCRIYWGTKDSPLDDFILQPRGTLTQSIDPRDPETWPIQDQGQQRYGGFSSGVENNLAGHYDYHPAYRNVCRLDFKAFQLGSTPNFPNISVILRRGTKWFTGSIAWEESGVNAMGPPFELLTDDLFGAGLPITRLSSTSWNNARSLCQNLNAKLAPLLTSVDSARSLLADYFAYFYGFVRTNARLLQVGIWDTGAVDSGNIVDDHALTAEPDMTPGTLDKTKNYFAAVFSNKDHWLNNDDVSARYVDQDNFLKVGERRPEWVQLPYVIDAGVAQSLIRQYGMVNAREPHAGDLQVRREYLASLLPGDLIKLQSAAYAEQFVCQILAITRPGGSDGAAKLSVRRCPGSWPALYIPPPIPWINDFLFAIKSLWSVWSIELPYGLRTNPKATQMTFLAVRGAPAVTGFNIFMSVDNVTYNQIGTQNKFAIVGRVTTTFTATAEYFDCWVFGYDLTHLVSQSEQQQADDTLLCFWGSWSIEHEIMSVGQVEALGGGIFRVHVLRGRFGTPPGSHPALSFCLFAFREDFIRLENTSFIPGQLVYFKFPSFSEYTQQNVSQMPAWQHQMLVYSLVPPPSIDPASLTFTGTLTVSIAIPAGFVVRFRTDGGEVDATYPEWPTSGGSYTTRVISASENLVARAFAPNGSMSEQVQRTYIRSDLNSCAPVTFSFTGVQNRTAGTLTLRCSTPARTIHWQVNNGTVLTSTGTPSFTCHRGDIVDAWASAPGLADSAATEFDNTFDPGGGYGGGYYSNQKFPP